MLGSGPSHRAGHWEIVPRQAFEIVRPTDYAPSFLDFTLRWRVATVGLVVGIALLFGGRGVHAEGDAGGPAVTTPDPAPAQPAAEPARAVEIPPLAKRPKRVLRIEPDRMPPEQVAAQRVLELFTYSWFVCIGAVVGSFLNVVIYRWPAGLSLLYPPSRCSSCLAPILIQHNLPIVGWLRLGGRCYACDAKISVRYPLIEATIAALFLAVAAIEFTSGGANLPVRPVNPYAGILWTVWHLKGDLLALYLYHTNLLTGLVAAAMIIWDGHRLPLKLLLYLAVTVLIPAFIWGDLHPVPVQAAGITGMIHPAGTTLVGALAGLLVGGTVWFVALGKRRIEGRLLVVDLLLLSALVGAAVGWQAALSFLAVAMALAFGWVVVVRTAACCDLGRGCGIVVALAAVTQVLAWKLLAEVRLLPHPDSSPASMLPLLAGLFVLAGLSRAISPFPRGGNIPADDQTELTLSVLAAPERFESPKAESGITSESTTDAADSGPAPNPTYGDSTRE